MNREQTPGPLDYAAPVKRQSRGPFTFWLATSFVLGASLLVWILSPLLQPSHYSLAPPHRVKCASNLRQIGQAILLYSNEFQGRYPDTLGDLLLIEDITSACLNCPESNDTPAVGPTTQAVIAQLTVGGHCSYIYLGKGLTGKTVAADTVIAYEPLANHGSGMNVLFGDGSVTFVLVPQANVILKQVADGKWPVVLRTATTTQPETSR